MLCIITGEGLKEDQIQSIEQATRKQFPKGIPSCGADALRFVLLSIAGQGRDIRLDARRIEGFRFFANKIWNAARFVLMNLDNSDPRKPANAGCLGIPENGAFFACARP